MANNDDAPSAQPSSNKSKKKKKLAVNSPGAEGQAKGSSASTAQRQPSAQTAPSVEVNVDKSSKSSTTKSVAGTTLLITTRSRSPCNNLAGSAKGSQPRKRHTRFPQDPLPSLPKNRSNWTAQDQNLVLLPKFNPSSQYKN